MKHHTTNVCNGININYLRNKNKQVAAIHNNAIIFDGLDKYRKAHPKNCNHFLRTFPGDFSNTTFDFQGSPTRKVISQIVQKCTFPVHNSNKTLLKA